MKRIAVHLLAVAVRRQLRRTPLPSRPSHEPLAITQRRPASSIKDIRKKLSSRPSKAISAITSAARLSRFWRRREDRRSECSASRECEGAGQAEPTGTATTINTLRDAMSEEGMHKSSSILLMPVLIIMACRCFWLSEPAAEFAGHLVR